MIPVRKKVVLVHTCTRKQQVVPAEDIFKVLSTCQCSRKSIPLLDIHPSFLRHKRMTNQNRCTNIQHAKIKKEETIKVKTRSYTKRQKVVTEKWIMASISYHYNPNVFENNAQIDDGYDDNDAEFGWRDNSPPRLEKLVSFSLQDEEIILPNKSNASDGDSIVIQYGDKLDGAALSVLKKSYPLVESLNGSSVLR